MRDGRRSGNRPHKQGMAQELLSERARLIESRNPNPRLSIFTHDKP
jgi:hypothetical protein